MKYIKPNVPQESSRFPIRHNTDYLPKITIDFATTFGSSFIQGSVASVDMDSKVVTLESGQTLSYTDLVVAVGNTGPFPSVPTDRCHERTQFLQDCVDLSQEVQCDN